MSKDINLLSGNEILQLFKGRELDIIEAVKSAYITHASGESSLPHSSFLRFPNNERDRIIALPAYLGGEFNLAGMKWISSFPGNLGKNLERASAVLLLNSTLTGRLEAILESSVISSSRTAASAALAAHYLLDDKPAEHVGLIGCGLINFETLHFLTAIRPEIESVFIYDLNPERAKQFISKCSQRFSKIKIAALKKPGDVFSETSLTSFATTAIKPHIFDISECTPEKIILHTSLRDLSPEIILSADNIVDDADHICRAQTSVHLAEQKSGNRDFIRCTLADILNQTAPQRQPEKVSVFSPFGLGILDMAVGKLACTLAEAENVGTPIESFFPMSWTER